MTKTEHIKILLEAGMGSGEIAEAVGCATNYVCMVRWRLDRPGYGARKQAEYRSDPDYRRAELDRQAANRWQRINGTGGRPNAT